jgi:hypothetical protein
MNIFFYCSADTSSRYRVKVEKTFILDTHTLTFYLCGSSWAAFFLPQIFSLSSKHCRYLANLPFW